MTVCFLVLSICVNLILVVQAYFLKHEVQVVRKEYNFLRDELRWSARNAMKEEAERLPKNWVRTPEDFKTYQQIKSGQIKTVEQLIDRDDA